MNLNGKTALVTGAGHGFGARTANALAAAGADIMGLGPDVADDCDTAFAVRALGRRFTAHRADLADGIEAQAVCDGILAEGPAIDLLIAVLDRTGNADDFSRMLQTGIVIPHCLSGCIAPGMAARGAGRIVFVTPPAPGATDAPAPELAAVTGGVAGLLHQLARAYGPRGVNVNTITLDRPDHPDRAAQAISALLFLASAQSEFLHGTTLPLGPDAAR